MIAPVVVQNGGYSHLTNMSETLTGVGKRLRALGGCLTGEDVLKKKPKPRRRLLSREDFKLIESDQARWRAVNAPHLVALVRAGARFERG
jgi:hypothetical protein